MFGSHGSCCGPWVSKSECCDRAREGGCGDDIIASMADASQTGGHPLRTIASMVLSESAVYWVVMVSGLLVIVANKSDAEPGEVLLKVVGTALVFWLAHVYSGTVAHLGDDTDETHSTAVKLVGAIRHSLGHLWGMLTSAAVPLITLGASALGVISQEQAVWGALWINVALLAVLGFWGVSRWSDRLWMRLTGALITAAFGLAMVALKVLIH